MIHKQVRVPSAGHLLVHEFLVRLVVLSERYASALLYFQVCIIIFFNSILLCHGGLFMKFCVAILVFRFPGGCSALIARVSTCQLVFFFFSRAIDVKKEKLKSQHGRGGVVVMN